MTTLHLHEQTVLLALPERKGMMALQNFALGGACLSVLCLHGRLSVEPGKNGWVEVVDRTPVGEPVLDDCLEQVVRARRRTRAGKWVMRFNDKKAYHRTAVGLCRSGVLRAADAQAWLFSRRRVYEIVDPEPLRHLISRLRETVFDDASSPDPETRVLVTLANAGGLLPAHFDKKQLRNRRRHLDAIAAGHAVSDAMSKAVLAAQREKMAIIVATSSS